jgi:chromosome partitioning protein
MYRFNIALGASVVAKTFTIAQQKGGAGKTTMATHLAVAWSRRHSVAVIDTDPQGSLTQWHQVRERRFGKGKTGLIFSHISGWRVENEIQRLKHLVDIIVIDSPPHADIEARAAIAAADLVVVPLQPSPMDVWATSATIKLCKQERVPVKMVLNRVNPQARITEVISNGLVGLAANHFGNRVAYAGSLMEGFGVTESQPNSIAADEVRGLAREILAYVNRKRAMEKKHA